MGQEEISEEEKKKIKDKIKNMSPQEINELQKSQCLFCKIVQGEIPSTKVYEDDSCLAILDIRPATKGHLLVMPKEHYPLMPLVPDEVLAHLYVVVQKLSKVLLKSMNATGTFIYVANGPTAGQNAQHFMVHLIPRKDNDGLLKNDEKVIETEQVQKAAELIKEKLELILGIKQEKLVDEKTKKKKDDVSLDDISNLFK
jgi:histidine triad (HIT) family protein